VSMMIPYAQSWFDNAARLAAFFHRSLRTVGAIFQESRFLYHARGKLRRFALAHFQKAYVLEQRSIREGTCRQCGTCCNLLFTCPSLTKQSSCLIYGKCRPEVCKLFPLDQRDIQEIELCGGRCGYRFPESFLSARPEAVSKHRRG
jgi:hypothetical protein